MPTVTATPDEARALVVIEAAMATDVAAVVTRTDANGTGVPVRVRADPAADRLIRFRNLHPSPRAVTDMGWSTARWFGVGGAGTYALGTDGGPAGPTYRRKRWTTATTGGAGDTGHQLTYDADNFSRYVLPAGTTTVTVAGSLRSSVAGRVLAARVEFRNAAGTVVATVAGATVTATANTWHRVVVAAAVPAGATDARPILDVVSGPGYAVGDTLDAGAVTVELGAGYGNFYDGAANPSGLFRFAWDSTANRSSSYAYAAGARLTDREAALSGPVTYTVTGDGATATASVTFARTAPNVRQVLTDFDGARPLLGTVYTWAALTTGQGDRVPGQYLTAWTAGTLAAPEGTYGLLFGTYAELAGAMNHLRQAGVLMLRLGDTTGADLYHYVRSVRAAPDRGKWELTVEYVLALRPAGTVA